MKGWILLGLLVWQTNAFAVKITSETSQSFRAMAVPDAILMGEQPDNLADFVDIDEISCSRDYPPDYNKTSSENCLKGRQRAFTYKKQYPHIYNICEYIQAPRVVNLQPPQPPRDLVGTCLVGWVDTKSWTPTDYLPREMEQMIHHCVRNQPLDAGAVFACFMQKKAIVTYFNNRNLR